MDLHSAEIIVFYITIGAYLLSTVIYWIWLAAKKNQAIGHLATATVIIGFLANTAALTIRTIITSRPPLTNGYEFILCFAWGIVAVFLYAEFRHKLKALGSFVMPIPVLLLAIAVLALGPDDRVASSIPPALKSKWLTYHVATAIFAYGAFAVSCGLSIMYLIKEKMTGNQGWISRFPEPTVLDELSYKSIGFAFPMLTLCIVTGAIWANYAWGTYWSWDPKETWSLITWFVYAGYLHARLMYGWKGKRAAWMSIIGFVSVLFTFFGVNYFLPGLHSYA